MADDKTTNIDKVCKHGFLKCNECSTLRQGSEPSEALSTLLTEEQVRALATELADLAIARGASGAIVALTGAMRSDEAFAPGYVFCNYGWQSRTKAHGMNQWLQFLAERVATYFGVSVYIGARGGGNGTNHGAATAGGVGATDGGSGSSGQGFGHR